MKVFSTSIQALEKGIQYSGTKHKAISDNIANVDTPNFKRKEVSANFGEVLRQTLQSKKTDNRHLEFSKGNPNQPFKVTTSSNSYSHNGNNVDIDKEMSDMAENQIYYYTLIDQLNGKFQSLQNVIKGGRS
ncbi:flagellar basal body rod protein FlgB [Sutcliffiella rhizosphaerae]|uniref:Flagellar basal body rod protein FlgB n=1 Tax=Sutcliffiella rhizosphaerae TaxID=2880967 RepID=A0ABN8A7H4_9BACI|nr:flagellar basal body rod protein FlgB [Sutcliffiella rhizosphaerae]CAG9619716.1 Flagellar basal body rod protein FlgB [Sutcliffiella rhizosphaerae]